MTTLSTSIDSESISFQSNTVHNTLLAEELRQKLASAWQVGPRLALAPALQELPLGLAASAVAARKGANHTATITRATDDQHVCIR